MPERMTATFEAAPENTPLRAYTADEFRRIFREALACELVGSGGYGRIVIGTRLSNPRIDELVRRGYLELPDRQQGYVMRCDVDPENAGSWLLIVSGTDDIGVLYGLRDLEHYLLENLKASGSRLESRPFLRIDWPKIEHRGHWVWGCNMPGKKAWMDNVSRWKLNELIHWDNFPPERGREYVEFAHARGISLNWGFGWGRGHWNVDLPADFVPGEGGAPLCPSDEYDRAFYRRVILEKIRNLYVPTGCDGIYSQSFTEFPKCTCDRCDQKTMGELMVDFWRLTRSDTGSTVPSRRTTTRCRNSRAGRTNCSENHQHGSTRGR